MGHRDGSNDGVHDNIIEGIAVGGKVGLNDDGWEGDDEGLFDG